MTEPFGHEKLVVYRKGMRVVVLAKALSDALPRRVAACDHLDRGAESILVNIAHASSAWSPNERIAYLGHANGSALECAACLDVLVAKRLLIADDISASKSLLAEVVSRLISMRKAASNRISEDQAQYRTKKGNWFDHEDLDVYQVGLQLVAWLESTIPDLSCSGGLRSKLDRSTTSIVLNIAEGNGRFAGPDQAKFYGVAYKATVQVDLATVNASGGVSHSENGRKLLRRIAAMITALSKVAGHG